MKLSRFFFSIFILSAPIIFMFTNCASERGGGSPLDNADAVRGGQLYDTWWKVKDVKDPNEPTTDNPGYKLTAGTQTGSITWRCKECHGWDYMGKDGAYGSSSHYTGVIGLMHASEEDPPDELFDKIKMGGGETAMSSFESHLSDEDIWDIVKFIKDEIIDESLYIDYSTKKPKGADTSNGQKLFESTCANCHGSDGRQINFATAPDKEYVGTIANDNPWELMHKIRFGQPGTSMPSAIKNGWSIQDVVDVIGYAQTLPVE